ncbi:MAG: GNAT family N-acetyltransferase [Theionarchaea archaeon]|nr:GNAT family N-acetyltransferase [Theionarchaea archaeon]
MKVGRVYGEFEDHRGRKVVLRTPIWGDLDDLLDMINTAVEERVDIFADKPVKRNAEAEWLGRKLAKIENDQVIGLVALCEGKVVGSSEVEKYTGAMSHVGELGALVKGGYREAGIGTAMLETLIRESRSEGLEILTLRVYSGNDLALHVYKKVGFRETGRVPGAIKRDGRIRDLVRMTMKL